MRTSFVLFVVAACGDVPAQDPKPDAAAGADARIDAPGIMPDAPLLGSQQNPATSCVVLKNMGAASGVYWLKDANGTAFETFCEQVRDGGGWALVYRSVLMTNGTTTVFWQIPYLDRFIHKGDPNPNQNFYAGSLYRVGRDYMDLITDLQDKTVVGAVVSTSGILESTMTFQSPVKTSGDTELFNSQFAAGWSAQDHDGDTLGNNQNCATNYGGVTQHYTACFVYSLGADGDTPVLDGGVGPHVLNTTMTALALTQQANSGLYSRVNRIERYTRW